MKCSPFLEVNISFALSLRAWISDASRFPSSSISATQMSPFQSLPATNAHPRNIHGRTFLPNWWSLDNLALKSDDIQPLLRTE